MPRVLTFLLGFISGILSALIWNFPEPGDIKTREGVKYEYQCYRSSCAWFKPKELTHDRFNSSRAS